MVFWPFKWCSLCQISLKYFSWLLQGLRKTLNITLFMINERKWIKKLGYEKTCTKLGNFSNHNIFSFHKWLLLPLFTSISYIQGLYGEAVAFPGGKVTSFEKSIAVLTWMWWRKLDTCHPGPKLHPRPSRDMCSRGILRQCSLVDPLYHPSYIRPASPRQRCPIPPEISHLIKSWLPPVGMGRFFFMNIGRLPEIPISPGWKSLSWRT